MSLNTNADQIKKLLNILSAIDADDREYVARFVVKNIHLGEAALIEKFEQDKADRLEAQAQYEHRRDKLLGDLSSEYGNDPVVAQILGVSSQGSAEQPSTDKESN